MSSDRPGTTTPTDLGVGLLVFAISAILIVWRLAEPPAMVFDETHYVRQGLAFFEGEAWLNKSHPPVGKWLIGASQALLGENPFAWRIPGALFGAIISACIYAVMRLFGFTAIQSVSASALTMLNQTLFVQSRTAMLDVYTLGFFALSATMLIWSGKRVRTRGGATFGLLISGMFLGLGAASKWTAGIDMILIWFGIFVWRMTETSPNGMVLPRFFGSGFAGWRHFSLVGAGLRQGLVSIIFYLIPFLPFLWMEGGLDLVALHEGMLSDVAGDLKEHPYASRWWEWPIMLEPMWYYFDRPVGQTVGDAAVFLVGNPMIYWAGLPAILAVFGFGLRRGDGAMLAISSAFLGFWLVWAAIPRQLTFSFYYEPAAMMLGMGIVAFISRILPVNSQPYILGLWLAAAAGFFAFFYPVLTAMPLEPNEWLMYRWFPIWS